ncbi:MAG: hypothetical protein ACYTG2_11185 [Planctomycetota bacterium]|jgi:Spy/CpxP family protein refolding chaperone
MPAGRTTSLIIVTLLLGGGLLAPDVSAQRRPQRKAPPGRQAQPAEGRPGAQQRKARRARIAKQLDLSKEQKARLRESGAQHRDTMRAKHEAMRAVRSARRQALSEILTPDQRAQMKRLLESRRARPGKGRDAGQRAGKTRPEPRPTRKQRV